MKRETLREAAQRIGPVVPYILGLAQEAVRAKMEYRDVAKLLRAAMSGQAKEQKKEGKGKR